MLQSGEGITMTIDAVFENGVLRPLKPLFLAENEQVTIRVRRRGESFEDDGELFDEEYAARCAAEADDSITIEEVRRDLSTIKGSLDDAIDEARGEY
jgi:predicted DNA-binding antitoxin AbrB/MazE fold protein